MNNNRQITERDLRIPEFKDSKLEDLEFRDDGAIVRKDRWETGICSIACILTGGAREFEIPDLVERVRALQDAAEAAQEINFCLLIDEVISSWMSAQPDSPEVCQRRINARLALDEAIKRVTGEKTE
jgi:hypothetical protein